MVIEVSFKYCLQLDSCYSELFVFLIEQWINLVARVGGHIWAAPLS